MSLPTRRTFVKITAAAATVALMTPLLASCSSTSSSAGGTLALWTWPDGLSSTVLTDQAKEFPESPVKASVIGGDFKQKLVTTFTGRSGLPAISGVKGEDMPYFLSEANLFTDLNTLGAKDVTSEYPAWKLAEATTSDGKLIGLPTDIGPAALYYREDVFKKAGLPSTPEAVAKATSTWEDYFALGEKLKAATGAKLFVDIGDVFTQSMGQSTTKFVDEKGDFIGDSAAVKEAWDRAVQADKLGLTAGITDGSPDWSAAITKGTLPAVLGASWHQADIKAAAPSTSGEWRVAPMPGGPANIGGSFLTIPAGTKDAKAAFTAIKWILKPSNQVIAYKEKGIFPSATAAFDSSALKAGDDFFGGQSTISVFADATKNMPTTYTSPYDSVVQAAYMTQLQNVESLGKNPDTAWTDALKAAKSALQGAK